MSGPPRGRSPAGGGARWAAAPCAFSPPPAGLWEKPFSPSKTSLQDFHVDEATVVRVPMMLQDGGAHWHLRDRHVPCSVLRLDYQGPARALLVLPDAGKMAQVEEVLTPQMLHRWNALLQRRYRQRPPRPLRARPGVSGR